MWLGGSAMADFIGYHAVATDTSDSGPALGKIGDDIYMAWTGEDNHHVNLMPIVKQPGDAIAFDLDRKITFENTRAAGGPALAQAEVRGETALAWAIDNPAGETNSIIGITLDRDLNTVRDLVSLEWTDHSPALGYFVKEVNLAWVGSNNLQINAAPLVFNELGWAFSSDRKSVSTMTSPWEISLAWRPAPNELFVAWTDEGNLVSIMRCHGNAWDQPPPHRTEFDLASRRTFGEYSDGGPAIAIQGQSILLAYRGSGNTNLNLLRVDLNDYSVISKRISGDCTPYRPALAYDQDHTYIAWTGEDDHLNAAVITRE